MKYRKKPVVIEALKWEENYEEMQSFMEGVIKTVGSKLVIETLEGDMTGEYGDWIIKGVKGEFYPVKEQIFKETYDEL